jgi:type IV pilus assembly protein PilV
MNQSPLVGRHSTHARRLGAGGFTLVEVLVTMVILSVGLLGVAALHTASLRNNLDSALRSQASALAADIADRMRGNRAVALTGSYDIAIGATRTVVVGSPLADKDVKAWKDALARALPGGDGSIVRTGDVFTITVQWGERLRQGETDATFANLSFQTRTQI